MWFIREKNNHIFFINKQSKNIIHEKYEIKKTLKKFVSHVLMILLHDEKLSDDLWFKY
jgi:hypothetical protein